MTVSRYHFSRLENDGAFYSTEPGQVTSEPSPRLSLIPETADVSVKHRLGVAPELPSALFPLVGIRAVVDFEAPHIILFLPSPF